MECTYDYFNDLEKELKIKYPGWRISWGYIGNVGIGYDDRQWHISMRPGGIMTCWEYQDIYNVYWDKKTQLFEFDRDAFDNWVTKQLKRWKTYTDYNFVNKLEGSTEEQILINMLRRFGHEPRERSYSDKTLYYHFTRRDSYGRDDQYTYAKIEFAFDAFGNLVDVRAAT